MFWLNSGVIVDSLTLRIAIVASEDIPLLLIGRVTPLPIFAVTVSLGEENSPTSDIQQLMSPDASGLILIIMVNRMTFSVDSKDAVVTSSPLPSVLMPIIWSLPVTVTTPSVCVSVNR